MSWIDLSASRKGRSGRSLQGAKAALDRRHGGAHVRDVAQIPVVDDVESLRRPRRIRVDAHQTGWKEGFDLVRSLGNTVNPSSLAFLSCMPSWLLTTLLCTLSRSAAVKDVGQFGPGETRWLIDAMTAAAPGKTSRLLAVRP